MLCGIHLMGKFVNFNKRGYLLPGGVKDLIGMLPNKSGGVSQQSSSQPQDFALRHFETILTPLSDVASIVTLFLRPGCEARAFTIRRPDDPLEIGLQREPDGSTSCTVVFPDDPEWDIRVRESFGVVGLQQPPQSSFKPPTMFPGVQVQTIWHVVPIPDGHDGLVSFIRVVIERSCRAGKDTIVECARCEGESPA